MAAVNLEGLDGFRTLLNASDFQKFNDANSIQAIARSLQSGTCTPPEVRRFAGALSSSDVPIRRRFMGALREDHRAMGRKDMLLRHLERCEARGDAMTKGELKLAFALLGHSRTEDKTRPATTESVGHAGVSKDGNRGFQGSSRTLDTRLPNEPFSDELHLAKNQIEGHRPTSVAFELYRETADNFPPLSVLQECFKAMSITEKQFFNEIRQLYFDAVNASAIANPDETGSHVFQGGHVIVQDGGEHYDQWRAWVLKTEMKGGERWSSHYHDLDTQQYEIILPAHLGGCILFGKNEDQNTWFQAESWPATKEGLTGWLAWLAHGVLGYGAHVLSGYKNVGPLGYSDYSEKTGSALVTPPSYPSE